MLRAWRVSRQLVIACCMGLAVMIAGVVLSMSRAATPLASAEPEVGRLADCAGVVSDATASSGAAIRFSSTACGSSPTPSPVPNPGQPGAILPIVYGLASLPGKVYYVATNGNDAAVGTVAAPLATLAKAVSNAATGDSIVVRGGVYRQGNITVPASKTLRIAAYPGEVPIFSGARMVGNEWVSDGGLRQVSYTPQPITDGSGISFSSGQNLTSGGIGKQPDQAWIGGAQLRQVSNKSAVVDGVFWVDTASSRLYITASDAAKGGVELSQKDKFISLQSPGTVLEGLRITRFSNSADDYGVVNIAATADSAVLRHVEISESAFQAVNAAGNSNLLQEVKLQNVTLTNSNWMGVAAVYTDNFSMESVKITGMNQFNEFTHSPQSGGLKTSRTRHTKVLNSQISDNRSHGLWFDQSNYDVQVAGNTIKNNAGSGVFFEISDNLTMANNYVVASGSGQAVRLAGSSGLKLVNNTLVGGAAPLGVYVDNRSIQGCANPATPLCAGSYGSDRDTVRPYLATMDWIPHIDMLLNNIIAYPTGSNYCGTVTSFCITSNNGSATVPLERVLRGGSLRPQAVINGNIYANGTADIIHTPRGRYNNVGLFAAAMAGQPVGIGGFESNGKQGNNYVQSDGAPTGAVQHSQAVAVPANEAINRYVPAGTRHYGALGR